MANVGSIMTGATRIITSKLKKAAAQGLKSGAQTLATASGGPLTGLVAGKIASTVASKIKKTATPVITKKLTSQVLNNIKKKQSNSQMDGSPFGASKIASKSFKKTSLIKEVISKSISGVTNKVSKLANTKSINGPSSAGKNQQTQTKGAIR